MFCTNCGKEIADNASFCPHCGNRIKDKKDKNIFIALILTFFLTGLGSIYAGNTKKGLILLVLRILFIALGPLLNIFLVFSVIIWVYGFYETYRDVQIANGNDNPRLIRDFKNMNQNGKIITALFVGIILLIAIAGCIGFLLTEYSPSNYSNTHYYKAGEGYGGSSSHSSSHYSGVDTSPNSIARNDPDWYYDHYEYGDNPDIDDYLETEGYD